MKKTHRTLTACALALSSVVAGCGSSSLSGDAAPSAAPASSAQGSAERAIVEADIIQLDGGRLYALSASGSVSVVDVSTPGRLALLGQTRLGGTPFEMYRRGNLLITMWDGAISSTGSTVPPRPEPDYQQYRIPSRSDPNSGAAVVVLDMTNPKAIINLGGFPVPGELADSRMVGDVLYVASYENTSCYRCADRPRTMVTSFDLKDPTSGRQIHQAEFASTAPDSFNLPWGENWKRSLFVTPQRLYIGGHADIDPTKLYTGTEKEGIIDVLDISDASGKLVAGARIQVAGSVLSRWQMEERDGTFRVISQRGAGRTGNGAGNPEVDIFTVNSTQSYSLLGHTTLKLPRQEGLRTVRFDKDRAYAITYNQTDPLFTIDLSNPASPTVRGELHMPGFMYYLEPYGNRLIGLGIDRSDSRGSMNVSLFDVSNLDHPTMISRVPFATPNLGEDYAVLNYELPEDQDRIQKAFRVFPDGLVAVPFTAAASTYYGGDTCNTLSSGIQLVDWQSDQLVKQALLPMRGNPRRAIEKDGELIAVSDSNVSSFSLASHSVSIKTADVTIGQCVPKTLPSDYGYFDDYSYYDHYPHYRRIGLFGCSVSPGSAQTVSFSGLGLLLGVGILLRTLLRSSRGERRAR